MDSIEKWKPQQILLLEYLIENPSATRKEMAEVSQCGIGKIGAWLKDPIFVEAFYDRYMIAFGSKLPSVLNAMVREALEGNVQAGRLVLEHSGKLVKNVHIKHESPFEKFIAAEIVNDTVDAEFKEVIAEEVSRSLPERNKENDSPQKRIAKESKRMREIRRRKRINEKQIQNRKLRRRAEKVGLSPLKGGRPTKYDRKRWLQELEQREANPLPNPQT